MEDEQKAKKYTYFKQARWGYYLGLDMGLGREKDLTIF